MVERYDVALDQATLSVETAVRNFEKQNLLGPIKSPAAPS
jgi:hypothetical protein